MQNAILVLQDGKCFEGNFIGVKDKCIGEVCFTTGMTGYQHTITDPSFADQIVTFTFPHIGNVGINAKDNEREDIFASGVVMREISEPSHFVSLISINDWLIKKNVVGISGVDTRALTKHLRDYGSQNGMICSSDKFNLHSALQELSKYRLKDGIEITNEVVLSNHFQSSSNLEYQVVVIDFGVKSSIISRLEELGCNVKLVKPVHNFARRVLDINPDGVVLSNGPGDPEKIGRSVTSQISEITKSKIPIFGICMGHQLLGITLGAKTIRMDHGHRGSNHPVYEISTGRVEITSQNHGFVIDSSSLPDNVRVTHTSLFDGTIEGIIVKDHPIFSVQYHPEEAPGTSDSHYLFKRFISHIRLYRK
ncbi:MAG: glutamine-hydrolyzing carbamoyl-phosphate synthase small subunit [Wolbachia endosymbiont of Fragariocoptes setiger]|nr:glutamine-hydrolyzing carbamoyl-phosphate synthase small subunit [Wolbachia endosymbiont of Fragariocoptes setiger]